MSDQHHALAVGLFSEIFMVDQLARARLAKALPKGMELSQFLLLNHLSGSGGEHTPAQLARAFHLTRGAMTNTLAKLERAGYVHIRPDWDDARRKLVTISPAGQAACEEAFQAVTPVLADVVDDVRTERVKTALPVLRELRRRLTEES